MKLEVFDIDYDHRISSYVVSVRADYEWYLNVTSTSEHNLEIQRSIISGKKTYETLRADLKRGCVLPPLVLAMLEITCPNTLERVPADLFTNLSPQDKNALTTAIQAHKTDKTQIIDGLQRTNAIRSVLAELDGTEKAEFLSRPIRLEIWLNIEFFALAYRMLLLNAGQKPMSMKHQIEILADSMKAEFSNISGLDVLRGIDNRRRTQPGQFQLATLSGAFQAWLQKQPNIDLKSAVTEQLLADEAVETLGAGLNPANHPTGDDFRHFVEWIVKIDEALGVDKLKFLGSDTTILALSAAFARIFSKESFRQRGLDAMAQLSSEATEGNAAQVLDLELFEKLKADIDPKKVNVGEGTRNLVLRAFTEYVYGNGTKSMTDCWTDAASMG